MPECTKDILSYITNVYVRLGSLIITPIKMLSLALLFYFTIASITLMILYHLLNSFSIKLKFCTKIIPKKVFFFWFNSFFSPAQLTVNCVDPKKYDCDCLDQHHRSFCQSKHPAEIRPDEQLTCITAVPDQVKIRKFFK
jgi:hypothetical protein